MVDDVVFLVAGQPVMRKAEFAVATRAQSGKGAPQFDGRSEIQEIRVLGEWAFMWTKLTVVVTPPGGARSMVRRPYAVHPQEAKRKLGAGTRCQHAGACAGQMTAGAMKTRATGKMAGDIIGRCMPWEFCGKQEFQFVLPEENHLSKPKSFSMFSLLSRYSLIS